MKKKAIVLLTLVVQILFISPASALLYEVFDENDKVTSEDLLDLFEYVNIKSDKRDLESIHKIIYKNYKEGGWLYDDQTITDKVSNNNSNGINDCLKHLGYWHEKYYKINFLFDKAVIVGFNTYDINEAIKMMIQNWHYGCRWNEIIAIGVRAKVDAFEKDETFLSRSLSDHKSPSILNAMKYCMERQKPYFYYGLRDIPVTFIDHFSEKTDIYDQTVDAIEAWVKSADFSNIHSIAVFSVQPHSNFYDTAFKYMLKRHGHYDVFIGNLIRNTNSHIPRHLHILAKDIDLYLKMRKELGENAFK